jgi:hypothetical protein
VVWEALVGGGSLCRGGADGAGACQPAWAVYALQTVPSRYCKQFVSALNSYQRCTRQEPEFLRQSKNNRSSGKT